MNVKRVVRFEHGVDSLEHGSEVLGLEKGSVADGVEMRKVDDGLHPGESAR